MEVGAFEAKTQLPKPLVCETKDDRSITRGKP